MCLHVAAKTFSPHKIVTNHNTFGWYWDVFVNIASGTEFPRNQPTTNDTYTDAMNAPGLTSLAWGGWSCRRVRTPWSLTSAWCVSSPCAWSLYVGSARCRPLERDCTVSLWCRHRSSEWDTQTRDTINHSSTNFNNTRQISKQTGQAFPVWARNWKR